MITPGRGQQVHVGCIDFSKRGISDPLFCSTVHLPPRVRSWVVVVTCRKNKNEKRGDKEYVFHTWITSLMNFSVDLEYTCRSRHNRVLQPLRVEVIINQRNYK